MRSSSSSAARPNAQSVEAALVARIEELAFLRQLNDRLTRVADFPSAARALVELVGDQLQVEAVAYVSVDPQRQVGRLEAVAPAGEDTGVRRELALDVGPLAACRGEVEPIVVHDVPLPPWEEVGPVDAGRPGVLFAVPTRVREVTTGLLLVFDRASAGAEREDEVRRLLAIVATLAALALDVARNQVREEFLATLRHDINNPVDAALGYTEMLGDALQTLGRSDLLLLTGSVVDSLKTVADLVSNYLSMAAIDRGASGLNLDELDFGVLAAEVVRRFRPFAADKQVAIACHGHCPALRADRRQLGRVISNLVSNAIKYTPPEGRVDVTVMRAPGAAVLEVRDTGFGLAEEHLPHLFGRYVRLHRERGIPGTGLGLFISRAIVEAHGGSISVVSARGAGSTFTVRLPHRP